MVTACCWYGNGTAADCYGMVSVWYFASYWYGIGMLLVRDWYGIGMVVVLVLVWYATSWYSYGIDLVLVQYWYSTGMV